MKVKKYLALASFLYKLIMFFITPVAYLSIIAYISDWEYKMVLEVILYSSFLLIDLWMDYYLFHGITNKGQMELLKTAYHGLDILSDGLFVDKLRRFLELFLLTALSQYTGLIAEEDIQIPMICFYLLEALLQYILLEGIIFVTRQLTGPMVFFLIAMLTFLISVVIQIPLIWIVEWKMEYVSLAIGLVLAIILSVCSHLYMMKLIYAGKYDERRV